MTDDEDVQELVLKARLAAAQELIDSGKLEEAERMYKQALEQAEVVDGKDSPLAALVLIDLYDLYEKQGRHDEGKPLWSQIRQIAILHLQQHL